MLYAEKVVKSAAEYIKTHFESVIEIYVLYEIDCHLTVITTTYTAMC